MILGASAGIYTYAILSSGSRSLPASNSVEGMKAVDIKAARGEEGIVLWGFV